MNNHYWIQNKQEVVQERNHGLCEQYLLSPGITVTVNTIKL